MRDWFVPPIVISFVLVVTLVATLSFEFCFSRRYHKHSQRCPNWWPYNPSRGFLYRPRSQPTYVLSDSVVRRAISSLVSSTEFAFRSALKFDRRSIAGAA